MTGDRDTRAGGEEGGMRLIGRSLVIAAVLTGAFAAPASATVSHTQVTSPTGVTFYDPDLDGPPAPLTISGTVTSDAPATDTLRISCFKDHGDDGDAGLANNVPITGGNQFSAQIDLTQIPYRNCLPAATPSNIFFPGDLSDWEAPAMISVGGHRASRIGGGVNDGKLYDYYQASAPPSAQWDVNSAGDTSDGFLETGFAMNTAALEPTGVFGTSRLEQNQAPQPELTVDGRTALLPYAQSSHPTFAGFQGIENYTHSIDGSGQMHVSDTEPISFCSPEAGPCSSFTDTGIRLNQRQDGDVAHNALAVQHDFVNMTTTSHQIHVVYSIGTYYSVPGWAVPGDTTPPNYVTHNAGDEITPPAAGGPDKLVATYSATSKCINFANPCGGVTWSDTPQAMKFASDDQLLLSYDRDVPPGCSARIALTYSVGYPQFQLDGFIPAIEAALANQPSITCPSPVSPPAPAPAPATTKPAKRKKCAKAKKKRLAESAAKKKCKKKTKKSRK